MSLNSDFPIATKSPDMIPFGLVVFLHPKTYLRKLVPIHHRFSQFPNSMHSPRERIIILASLFLCSFGFGQNRVVITSGGDIIQLKKGESSREVAEKLGILKLGPDLVPPCGTTKSLGYDPNQFLCNNPFVAYHHDV